MNVLVTVGTTSFDTLIHAADLIAEEKKNIKFLFQIGNGTYVPKNGKYVSFTNNIDSLYDKSDLVICHAGAGTIYRLLELEKKVILVPNLERVDKHQSDISLYMERGGYLSVAWSINDLKEVFERQDNFNPVSFKKENFFKFEEIANFIIDK
ncbi:glycosyltransferase [Vibrio parahaemolyticus]|nr:glycosyltransferase [Vibrio parahaemolyticus]